MTALDEDYNLHDRMGRIEVWSAAWSISPIVH